MNSHIYAINQVLFISINPDNLLDLKRLHTYHMPSINPVTGILGTSRAAHLLRRATMGFRVSDLTLYATKTAQEAIQLLFQSQPEPAFPTDPASGSDWIYPNTVNPGQNITVLNGYTKGWWLEAMRKSPTNATERMLWFFHTHFPIILTRIEGQPQLLVDYLRLLRYYALGNYKKLAKAICIDNGILIHLDGNLNVKSAPQENFAREFLELFTVGKGEEIAAGNYTTFTEDDVRAITKVLTGWSTDLTFQTIDPITGIPTGKVKGNGSIATHHDASNKQLSASFNNAVISTSEIIGGAASVQAVYQELDDLITLLFNSEHTARNICRRIYREFVYFNITPEVETDIIAPMAATLMANDYEITSVLEQLFQSEHFYDLDTAPTDDDNIGAIIKSPVDLIIGTLRLFEIGIPSATTDLENHYRFYDVIDSQLSLQGIEFIEPYDVAGYDPYFQVPDFQRYWISSNYLANRYKFAELLISGIPIPLSSAPPVKLDIVAFVRNKCSNPSNPVTLTEELCRWMLPIELSPERFSYFKDAVLLDQLSAINWANEWNNYISSTNDANVRVQLEALAIALMQSPEYQLY